VNAPPQPAKQAKQDLAAHPRSPQAEKSAPRPSGGQVQDADCEAEIQKRERRGGERRLRNAKTAGASHASSAAQTNMPAAICVSTSIRMSGQCGFPAQPRDIATRAGRDRFARAVARRRLGVIRIESPGSNCWPAWIGRYGALDTTESKSRWSGRPARTPELHSPRGATAHVALSDDAFFYGSISARRTGT